MFLLSYDLEDRSGSLVGFIPRVQLAPVPTDEAPEAAHNRRWSDAGVIATDAVAFIEERDGSLPPEVAMTITHIFRAQILHQGVHLGRR